MLVDYVQILGISGKKRGHYLACVGFKREGEGYGMGVGIWGDCGTNSGFGVWWVSGWKYGGFRLGIQCHL